MDDEQPIQDSAEPASSPAASPEKPVLEAGGAKVQMLQYSSAATAPDDWIHIFRARDYLEANLLVGKLQESGIHARVDMENVATMGSWAGGGPGGSNVQVLSSEAVEARRLIDELEDVRAARRARDEVHCPNCNHHPVKREWRPVRLAALGTILLSLIVALFGIVRDLDFPLPQVLFALGIVLCFVPSLPRWRCPACGHQWAQAEPEEQDDEDDEE